MTVDDDTGHGSKPNILDVTRSSFRKLRERSRSPKVHPGSGHLSDDNLVEAVQERYTLPDRPKTAIVLDSVLSDDIEAARPKVERSKTAAPDGDVRKSRPRSKSRRKKLREAKQQVKSEPETGPSRPKTSGGLSVAGDRQQPQRPSFERATAFTNQEKVEQENQGRPLDTISQLGRSLENRNYVPPDIESIVEYDEPEACPNNCGAKDLLPEDMDNHLEKECPKRLVDCEYCEQEITFCYQEDHYSICPDITVVCPVGCSNPNILRKDIEYHLHEECELFEHTCPLTSIGCTFRGTRQELNNHISGPDIVKDHFQLLCQATQKQIELTRQYDDALAVAQHNLELCKRELVALKREVGHRMIWKITNWEERFSAASTNKRPCIASPPFYSCRHGYKLALSLCPYGDSEARGEFMSLYICICKGEYDPLLDWPFRLPINLNLLDQAGTSEARKNITFTIQPNPCHDNKSFLSMPTSQRNTSFGAQQFVALDTLKTRDYIKDNTMFISVTVDHSNLIDFIMNKK